MEGRHPPPKAEHPFPDNPDFSRFWSNKRTVKAFFKFASVTTAIWMGLLFTHYYFNKDYPYFMGIKLRTPEEMQKRMDLSNKANEIRKLNSSIIPSQMSFQIDKVINDKPNEEGLFVDRNIVFDDEIRYSPGMVISLSPVPETKASTEETKAE